MLTFETSTFRDKATFNKLSFCKAGPQSKLNFGSLTYIESLISGV